MSQDEPGAGNRKALRMTQPLPAILTGMKDLSASPAARKTPAAGNLGALIKAVEAQDRAAFEVLYDATVQRVFSLALRITRQETLAEEVVGDLYLQVWQQASSYAPERGSVIAWLCVLCRSRALDALRRANSAARQAEVSLDALPEQEDSQQPPDLLSSVEQGSALHTALGTLSEQQRQLVALAYFRGYSHSELATITNTPVGTVKTHLHRTMIRLKELLSNGAGISGESDE